VISRIHRDVATAWKFLVFVDILGGHTTTSQKAMLIIGKKFASRDYIPYASIQAFSP
jgi:hypothetical protein